MCFNGGLAITTRVTFHPRRTAHRSYSPCSIMFVKISEYAEISACLQAVHQVSQTTSSVARSVAVKLCLVAPPLHTSRGRGEGAAAPLRFFEAASCARALTPRARPAAPCRLQIELLNAVFSHFDGLVAQAGVSARECSRRRRKGGGVELRGVALSLFKDTRSAFEPELACHPCFLKPFSCTKWRALAPSTWSLPACPPQV